MIAVQGASLIYQDHGKEVFACEDINLTVKDGEFVGILGPSGSGKSSLLYMMSGLKTPSRGNILFNGQDIHLQTDAVRATLRLNEFGFVFQHPFLIGYLTAFENVLVAHSDQNRGEQALELLRNLGLKEKLHRLPHELSGGERQRICIARALLGNPKVVFCDEPTAALDHKTGMNVMALLNQYRGAGSLVVVTHDESMIVNADRIVRIQEGCLVLEGKSSLEADASPRA